MRVLIRVADELNMPDKRGACVIGGMTMRQEADFWCPGNLADPAFAANPGGFEHDSMGNDGLSVGPFQQQTSRPGVSPAWGWGGLVGDPEGTRKRLDPYESTKLFMAALKKRPYRAGNAIEAGDWAQDVQKSGVPDAYDDDWNYINALYNSVAGTATTPPPPATYGMPRGSNSGGYGGNGVRFPDWVYALGNAFGVLPSTYKGHQEDDRSYEKGYAPNPQGLNRGIDWAAPGTPDQWDRLTRFADYLATVPQYTEQIIWRNPRTKRSIEAAGGRHQPGYYGEKTLSQHENHVHTRQSKPIPLPGGFVPQPVPVPAPVAIRPAFQEFDMFNGRKNSTARSRPAMNFFLHTEEGNGTAESLAKYCQGQNGVSYHYTLRDRKVYNVVDTDYYSWSVLEANVFSINLCFAGSRAAFTREQWLQREADIEIAAYIAVQDCRKYGMSVEVLAPQWNKTGKDVYAGVPRSGISDHNYVTRELGIGDHTDVGPNFPWDVFTRYVNKYAATAVLPGDEMSQADVARLEGKIDRILLEQTQDGHTSLSQVREPNEGKIGTWCKIDRNVDGNVDLLATFLRTLLKSPNAKARLQRVATNVEPGRSPEDALIAQQMLVTVDRILRLIEGGPPARVEGPTGTVPGLSPNARDIASELAAIMPAAEGVSDLLRAENTALRKEIGRLNAVAAIPAAPSAVLAVADNKTTGDIAGELVDSVEEWTAKLMSMNAEQRQALTAALQALQLPIASNGSKK